MTAALQMPVHHDDLARDHVVARAGLRAAVVSDRGVRRTRNEDAGMVLADGARTALAVFDGVGGAPRGDAAACRARDVVATALGKGRAMPPERQLGRALAIAAPAVAQLAGRDGAPATTVAAAMCDGATVVACSIGDSRVYWLPDTGPAVQLTSDDVLAPGSHVITRWLGAGAPAGPAVFVTQQVGGPGWLLACTDGLWAHLRDAEAVARLVRSSGPGSPLARAEVIVAWANERGGHDNATVALARIAGPADVVRAA